MKTEAQAAEFANSILKEDDAMLFRDLWNRREIETLKGHFPAFFADDGGGVPEGGMLTTSDAPALTTSDAPALTTSDAPALTTSDAPALTTSDAPAVAAQSATKARR